ncbi:MAG: PRC-barrel domain-containing protein [Pseudomonadota bacterium]
MKPYMMTTALTLALAMSSAAMADTTMDRSMFQASSTETDVHVSDFIGMSVFAAGAVNESEWDIDEIAGMDPSWDNVGEINDLVMTRDGDIASVLVDIGGFLGMGERQIAMNMDQIAFVPDSDTEDPTDFFLVIPASKAELEQAPAYQGLDLASAVIPQDTDADMAHTGMDHMTLDADDIATLTTEDLTGARVYDASGTWIGEVDQLNIGTDGKIDAAIVDVGGFLGLGEKPVLLLIEDLNITREDGDSLNVSVRMTEAELKELPTWEG